MLTFASKINCCFHRSYVYCDPSFSDKLNSKCNSDLCFKTEDLICYFKTATNVDFIYLTITHVVFLSLNCKTNVIWYWKIGLITGILKLT